MNPPRILIVDDDPAVTRLCQVILVKQGFNVATALSADTCLNLLHKSQYDLLIADIRMPVMDGFEIATRARQIDPELGIIFITGHGSIELALRALRKGVDGLVLKPFSETAELSEIVDQVLAERSFKQDAARLKVLRPLFNLSETLLSETDTSRLERKIDRIIGEHFDPELTGIYNAGDESGVWKLVAGRSFDQVTGIPEDDVDMVFESIFSASSPIIIDPPIDYPVFCSWLEKTICETVFIPISWGERRYLVFSFRNTMRDGRFKDADLDTAIILWRQVVIALENTQLYSNLRAKINEVEESQQALIMAEKMAISGRLLGSLAHEINNPLQSVQNCLHLAQRKDLTALDRETYVELAVNEVQRLSILVQNALKFYRSRGIEFHLCNLKEIVDLVLNLMTSQLNDAKVEIIQNFPTDLPEIMIVPDQVQQVFLNLLLNAIDAVQALPAPHTFWIDCKVDEDHICVCVEDSGQGLPQDAIEHIFEPFFTTKPVGTGLGLTISYGIIVDIHHGEFCFVPPIHAQGARVRVSLPRG